MPHSWWLYPIHHCVRASYCCCSTWPRISGWSRQGTLSPWPFLAAESQSCSLCVWSSCGQAFGRASGRITALPFPVSPLSLTRTLWVHWPPWIIQGSPSSPQVLCLLSWQSLFEHTQSLWTWGFGRTCLCEAIILPPRHGPSPPCITGETLKWVRPTPSLESCKLSHMGTTQGGSNTQFHQSVQSLSRVRLSATPWIAARQASLSITNSRSLLKLMPIKAVMPSSHLILCHPLFLLPPIPPSIRAFSNESTLCMRWPKYWNFSFNISPSNEHPGLISFMMDWLDLLAVQGTP